MNKNINAFHNTPTALLTDLYQLTMAYGYWKKQISERESVFHLFFRKRPFGGDYALSAGLGTLVEYLNSFSFERGDLDYLASLQGSVGQPLFEEGFLRYLEGMTFTADIDALPEGTLAFPYEPMLRIQGPLALCQLLETPILNIMNYQTIVATKASRICQAAQGDFVFEFGLRRAQGPDGGLSGSRASYVGGCHASSNTMAGKLFGIPVQGTLSHSWVMVYDGELESFRHYADVMPNDCVLLVDTFDTIKGVENAIIVGKELKRRGGKLAGIRLDSGDLASLSRESRKRLDKAGFKSTKIIASNDLDEYAITEMKKRGSCIDTWGVGTNLITADGQPALDGVYKLSAIRNEKGDWKYKIKLSEEVSKTSNAGILQVRRYKTPSDGFVDLIYDIPTGISSEMVDMMGFDLVKTIPEKRPFTDLLVPVFRGGKQVYTIPSLKESRSFGLSNLKRFIDSDRAYFVGLERSLHVLKERLQEEHGAKKGVLL